MLTPALANQNTTMPVHVLGQAIGEWPSGKEWPRVRMRATLCGNFLNSFLDLIGGLPFSAAFLQSPL